MSERYRRLFSLPVNLYATGSPIVIAAGALQKDNQTGKVLAQLKLRNIGKKTIKAATVSVEPLDTVGKSLGEPVTYQYLDLHADRDADFGQKMPVALPDAATRSFAVSVVQVIFTDNSIWNADNGEWKSLNCPKPLDAMGDSELVKQFRIEYGGDCANLLLEQKDLWHCVCGAVNHQEETNCHRCRKVLTELQVVDLEDLQKKKEERLTREQAEAEAARKLRKKVIKMGLLGAAILLVVVIATVLLTQVVIPNSKYTKAVNLMEAGQYEQAIAAFEAVDGYKDTADQIAECSYLSAIALMDSQQYEEAIAIFKTMNCYKDSGEWFSYKDSAERISECKAALEELHMQAAYAAADALAESGENAKAAIAFGKLGDYQDARERSFALWTDMSQSNTVSAGSAHTVALKNDGTVMAIGSNKYRQCTVLGWTDIVAISATGWHTTGLKNDNTVVAVGDDDDDLGYCNVSYWTDIVAVGAGWFHTVGLKSDGTVVAVGTNSAGRCDVSDWTDIIAVSAGEDHTVGLKGDGTVVAVGRNDDGRCDVSDWTDIVAISAGGHHTVGLKSDGTIVAVGSTDNGRCDVSDWTDIKIPN